MTDGRKLHIVFLGAPGAGKGTQAATVAQDMNLKHIATGDLFRQAQSQDTELARQAKFYMEKGQLVPDEITIKMVLERIAQPDCSGGVIFDGFPRTLAQAEALDKALAEQGKSVSKVVFIDVDQGELLKRLTGRWICRACQTPYHEISSPPKVQGKCDKCGGELYQRADDKEETIKERLQVYFKETAPLIEYYRKTGKILEIEGVGEVAEVGRRITGSLKKEFGN